MGRKILSIDIRYDSISAVLMVRGLKENRVLAHEYIAVSDMNEIDSCIGICLDNISKNAGAGIKGSSCIISIPPDDISFRNISLPFNDQKKISQVLPFELEQSLPLPVDDLVIDFHTIESSEKPEKHTDIIAATIEKTKLRPIIDLLLTYNIKPEIITVGGYPTVFSLLQYIDTPEDCILADIDTYKCTLFLIKSKKLRLIRSFSVGSKTADREKVIASRINLTLPAYEESSGTTFNPDKIYITGYGTETENFQKNLSKALNIPVSRTDFIRSQNISTHNNLLQYWDSDQMDTALTLALTDIKKLGFFNFRRGEFALKNRWAEYKSNLIGAGILAGLVLVMFFLFLFLDSAYTKDRESALDKQITAIFKETFPDVKKIVDPLKQMQIKIRELKEKAANTGEESTQNINNIDILYEINKRAPEQSKIILTRIVISPENIMLSGSIDTYSSAENYKSSLTEAEIFRSTEIISTNMDRVDNIINFKIKIEIEDEL